MHRLQVKNRFVLKYSAVGLSLIAIQLKDLQEEIKQGIGKDLKQTGDQLDQLERLATLSSIAYNHVASNDPKTKNLFRPSNFRILDYESECIILRKSLR